MKETATKLKEYLKEKYGEPMGSSLVGYRKHDMRHSKCDMCHEVLLQKESFRYVPLLRNLVDYDELWICKTCA